MAVATVVLTGFVAVMQFYFLVLEMFLWTTPFGQKTFKRTAAEQEATKILAANQGLYNGFLAAGLIWGLVLGDDGTSVKIFFLSCVLVAGLYGGATANRKILLVQALPAAIALVLVLLS